MNHYRKYHDVDSQLVYTNEMSRKSSKKFTYSVVIPTYKRPESVIRAIDSVLRLNTNSPIYVIIVDNDSTQKSFYKIKGFLDDLETDNTVCYYINKSNIGMFGNWNRCIELSKSEWFTILNDDDQLHPEWLQTVSKYTDRYDLVKVDYDVQSNPEQSFDFNENTKSITTNKILYSDLFISNINPGSLGLMMKRSSCLSIGGYDEAHYPVSDYDFLVRYIREYGGGHVKCKLALYNMIGNESDNVVTKVKFIEKDYLLRKEQFILKNKGLNALFLRLISRFLKYRSFLIVSKLHPQAGLLKSNIIKHVFITNAVLFVALKIIARLLIRK